MTEKRGSWFDAMVDWAANTPELSAEAARRGTLESLLAQPANSAERIARRLADFNPEMLAAWAADPGALPVVRAIYEDLVRGNKGLAGLAAQAMKDGETP